MFLMQEYLCHRFQTKAYYLPSVADMFHMQEPIAFPQMDNTYAQMEFQCNMNVQPL